MCDEEDAFLDELNARDLGELMPCGFLMKEPYPTYRPLYANPALLNMLGYRDLAEMTEALHGSCFSFVWPEDQPRIETEEKSRLHCPTAYETAFRMRRKDNTFFYVRQRTRHRLLKSGREVILATYYDVTGDREAVQERENLLNSIPGGVALYQMEGEKFRPLYLSDGIPALTGHTWEAYRKATEVEQDALVVPADREKVRGLFKNCAAGGGDGNLVLRMHHLDSSAVWVRCHCSCVGERNGAPLLHVVYHNITSETGAYRRVMDNARIGIAITDRNTREIIYANTAACRMIGWTEKSPCSCPCYEFLWRQNGPCADCTLGMFAEEKNLSRDRYFPETGISCHAESCRMDLFGCPVYVTYLMDVTELHRGYTALTREKLLFGQAVADAHLMAWEYDLPTRSIVSENSVLQRAGYVGSVQDVPLSQLRDGYVDSESREDYLRMFRHILAGDTNAGGEFWFCRNRNPKDRHCLKISYSSFPEADGKPKIAYGLARDITEEKEGMRKYRQSLQLLLRTNPESVGSFHMNLTRNTIGQTCILNKNAFDVSSCSNIDRYFLLMREIIPDPADRAEYEKLFSRERMLNLFREGRTTLTLTHRCLFRDGTTRWITTSVHMLQNPVTRDVEAVAYALDVHSRVLDEKIARCLMDRGYDTVAVIYPEYSPRHQMDFRFVAPGCAKLLDPACTSYEEHRMNTARNLFSGEERERYLENTRLSRIAENVRANGSWSFTAPCLQPGEKEPRYRRFSYFPLDTGGILAVTEDITEVRRQEQARLEEVQTALRSARKASAAKSEFLSNMSHDIRTPMNAILNLTRLARDELGETDRLCADLTKISTAGEFLLGLINDILDMSKIESGKMTLHPEPYTHEEFMGYIESVFLPLCQRKHLHFHCEKDSTAYPLMVDRVRFNQIFFNILSNAVKYTPPGGSVEFLITGGRLESGREETEFLIRDTGRGMSQEFQKRMFLPFEREDTAEADTGTGLGLPIAKKIVAMMGGTITIRSELGKGTEVSIHLALPVALKAPARSATALPPVENAEILRGKRVLIAEDHPINREVLCRLLQKRDIAADCAENGAEAVEQFRRSAPGTYAAILMDVRMPVMNGLEAAAAIRALPHPQAPTVPIVAMTANALDVDREQTRKAGMTVHLSKPINPAELYGTLAEL